MNMFLVYLLSTVISAGILEYRGAMEFSSSFSLDSNLLGETVEVMLRVPPEGTTGPFPLLIVLDGGEYFQTFAGFVDAVSGYGDIPEMIVAGVECGDHLTYCTPTLADIPDGTPVPQSGKAGEFLDFLEQELVPAIENDRDAAAYTVLFGHSLAGLFTLYAMQEQGGVFEGFIASSPSLWWDSEVLTSNFPSGFQEGSRLFISLGNEGPTMGEPFQRYLMVLNAQESIDFRNMTFSESSHQRAPFKSFIYGMEYIFQPWVPAGLTTLGSVTGHYALLSEIYGYDVIPPEGMLNRLGYALLGNGRAGEAVEAFSMNVTYHPESSNVYDSLGEGLLFAGDTAGAAANYRISLEMNPENENARRILQEIDN